MKRGIALLLTLVLALTVLAVPAMAAETEETPAVYNLDVESGYTVSMKTESGDAAAAFTGIVGGNTGTVYEDAAKLTLTFTGQAGKQYMVFLLEGKKVPTKDSIQYINQADGTVTVTFEIYPKDLKAEGEYHLYVSGTDLDYTEVATFSVTKSWEKTPYIFGDVDGDGKINSIDALMVLQYNAQIEGYDELTEQQLLAADVNRDNQVNSIDALAILQINAAGNAQS